MKKKNCKKGKSKKQRAKREWAKTETANREGKKSNCKRGNIKKTHVKKREGQKTRDKQRNSMGATEGVKEQQLDLKDNRGQRNSTEPTVGMTKKESKEEI